jgi:hypothetical protein
MALGAFVMYWGVAVLIGSRGAAVLLLLGAGSLVAYIKCVEEEEMEIRFAKYTWRTSDERPF